MQYSTARASSQLCTFLGTLCGLVILTGAIGLPGAARAEPYLGRAFVSTGHGPYASGYWTHQPSPNTLIIAEVSATDGNGTTVYTGYESYVTHGQTCGVWVVVFDLDDEGNLLGGVEYDALVETQLGGDCSLEFDRSLRGSARITGQQPDGWILKFGPDGYFYEWNTGPISFDVTLEPIGEVLPAHYAYTWSNPLNYVSFAVRSGRGRYAAASGVAAGITLPSTGDVPTGGNHGLLLQGGETYSTVWTAKVK